MIKITGNTSSDGSIRLSVPESTLMKCNRCRWAEKTSGRTTGLVSCPKCGSDDVSVTGEKK